MSSLLAPARDRLLVLILIAALGLRLVMADGGIWMDEAWSAIFARHVGSPLGVFFGINHDNNHHLNTLWLQLTGMSAPTLVMRAPAILFGALAVWLAACFARHDGRAAMLATAALFAASPVMMLYGSEARGYALVTVAILCVLLFVRDWIDGNPMRRNAAALATGLGMFSHLVMLPALVLTAGWAFVAQGGLRQPVRAAKAVLGALDLALITGLAIGFFIVAGAITQGGLGFASFSPYSALAMLSGIAEMASLLFGIDLAEADPATVAAVLAAVLALLVFSRPRAPSGVQAMALIFAVAMPCAVVILNLGNSEFGRYHLIAAIGVLILIGNRIGLLWERGGMARLAGGGALLALCGLMLAHDIRLIRDGRGKPQEPVEIMMQRAPGGTSILVTLQRSDAPLRIAALQRNYRLVVDGPGCAPAEHLLVTRTILDRVRPRLEHCGAGWVRVAGREARQLSGESWALYVREGLQSGKAVANGPRPAR